MTRSELIIRVKTKLDEYAPSGASLPFDDYVGPLLDESARDLLAKAPLHLVAPTSISLTNTVFENDKSYIPVPSDWIRIHEIRYPLWKKSVRTAISRENPEYQVQENEYIKGGYGRPEVAVVTTSILGGALTRYLECSKVIDGATPLVATYVKTLSETGDPETKYNDLNDQLTDSLSWLCTIKVFSVLGYSDKAKLAMEHYNNALLPLTV